MVSRYRNSPEYFYGFKEIPKTLTYHDPIRYTFMSRYSGVRVIQESNKLDSQHHESINKISIPLSPADTYISTDCLDENRIDIISNKAYGSPLYWWIIAIANDIMNPFDIPIGTTLRIPPLSSVYGVKGLLK